MKPLTEIAVVALGLCAVIALAMCVYVLSTTNNRIKDLDTKVELHAAVTRLIDERSKDTQARMIRLEQRSVATSAAIALLNHKLGDPIGKPDYGDTFPESNDPAECK